MGRLFWKCFLATWVTLILAGAATFFGMRLYRLAEDSGHRLMHGPRAEFELGMAAAVLRHAGPETLAHALDETGSPMLVIGPAGRDIRGRAPTADLAALALNSYEAPLPDGVLRVETATDVHTLLIPGGLPAPGPANGPPPPPSPWEPLAFAFLASVLLSALLAWYLARPVRELRGAFSAMSEGRLDTRVGDLMPRDDEFADLGHSFDRMAEKLQTLILAQRRLLHDVSHELRSPLGRLQVALGIARRDPSRTDFALERMELEVERLSALIGEILSLTRLNSGVEKERAERIDLGELAEGIVHDARFESGDRGCEVHLEELANVHVHGRPRLLARALENVVRNGLRFSPPGGVLTVDVGFSNGWAVIRVCDQGPGIPEQELEAAFEPFARGRNADDSDGFGLGLAIARGAVELHGGAIEASNRREGGLCVEIRLPSVTA